MGRNGLKIAVIVAVLGLSACGRAAPVEESTHTVVTTDTRTTQVAKNLPASCAASPTGSFGLTSVELTKAAGHPDGAKNVIWHTRGQMPPGTVVFTLTSGDLLRGLKFLDGEVVANYAFPLRGGTQQNFEIPPYTAPDAFGVFITANDSKLLGATWVADLEVEGESTGTCKP